MKNISWVFGVVVWTMASTTFAQGALEVEGGSDRDEVYTFALFHSAVVGVMWTF